MADLRKLVNHELMDLIPNKYTTIIINIISEMDTYNDVNEVAVNPD